MRYRELTEKHFGDHTYAVVVKHANGSDIYDMKHVDDEKQAEAEFWTTHGPHLVDPEIIRITKLV
jgi:hypothetical protein